MLLHWWIFENYNGFSLPVPSALEKLMRDVGLSSKQIGKARQAFMRSAEQTDFSRMEKMVLCDRPAAALMQNYLMNQGRIRMGRIVKVKVGMVVGHRMICIRLFKAV